MFYYDIIQEMNGRKAQRTNEKASAFIEKMNIAAQNLYLKAKKNNEEWFDFVISEYAVQYGGDKNLTRCIKCLLTLIQRNPNLMLKRLEDNARERFLKKPTYSIKYVSEQEKKCAGIHAYATQELPEHIAMTLFEKTQNSDIDFAVILAVASVIYNDNWIELTIAKIAGERLIPVKDVGNSLISMLDNHLLVIARHCITTEKNFNIYKTYYQMTLNEESYIKLNEESQNKEIFVNLFNNSYSSKIVNEKNIENYLCCKDNDDSKEKILKDLEQICHRIKSLDSKNVLIDNEELERYRNHYSKLDGTLIYLKNNIVNKIISEINSINESDPDILKAVIQDKINDAVSSGIEESKHKLIISERDGDI